VRGSAVGRPLRGSFDAKLTVDWARATTRNGMKCTTAGATSDLSAAGGNALTFAETGTVCKKGTVYTFRGSYRISGGSGKYATQGVGSGAAAWTFNGKSLAGTMKGKFDPNATRPEGG
jgi:hypothetical protein